MFIVAATEHSQKPEDDVQFAEMLWGAAVLAVKEYYLTHFNLLIKCHRAGNSLVRLLTLCFNSVKEAVDFLDIWEKANS